MTELVDGRHERQLDAEMVRRATAVLSADGSAVPPGTIAHAIIGAAARIGEEVTRRLDRVPEKQADNFYAAMGIGRDPARPARVPVAFKLADPAPGDARAPAATRLTAETGDLPAVFEIERGITLAPGSIVAMSAVDLQTDWIFLPPRASSTLRCRASRRSCASSRAVPAPVPPSCRSTPPKALDRGGSSSSAARPTRRNGPSSRSRTISSRSSRRSPRRFRRARRCAR